MHKILVIVLVAALFVATAQAMAFPQELREAYAKCRALATEAETAQCLEQLQFNYDLDHSQRLNRDVRALEEEHEEQKIVNCIGICPPGFSFSPRGGCHCVPRSGTSPWTFEEEDEHLNLDARALEEEDEEQKIIICGMICPRPLRLSMVKGCDCVTREQEEVIERARKAKKNEEQILNACAGVCLPGFSMRAGCRCVPHTKPFEEEDEQEWRGNPWNPTCGVWCKFGLDTSPNAPPCSCNPPLSQSSPAKVFEAEEEAIVVNKKCILKRACKFGFIPNTCKCADARPARPVRPMEEVMEADLDRTFQCSLLNRPRAAFACRGDKKCLADLNANKHKQAKELGCDLF